MKTSVNNGLDNPYYYSFGMLQPDRYYNAPDYRFGFNGKEMDNEVKGLANQLDFGARGYDSRLGRFLSIDPLIDKFPYYSSYLFAGNSPILFLDKEGKFKIVYNKEALKEAKITPQQLARFENIVKNISNITNENVLKLISDETNYKVDRIKDDFKIGNGPIINVTNFDGGAEGVNSKEITWDVRIIKRLASINGSDKEYLSEQVMGAALTILHEYTHTGDKAANQGKTSGQFQEVPTPNGHKRVAEESKVCIPIGTQPLHVSITGHRGHDVEDVGFGVQVLVDDKSSFVIEKGTTGRNFTPNIMNTILEDLHVK